MLHIKYEIDFLNTVPSYEEVIRGIEETSRLALNCNASLAGTWHSIDVSQYSTIEIEIKKEHKKVFIAIATHRLYYLEGVLLWTLKNVGGDVKEQLPPWVSIPYDEMDKDQLRNIPGQPHYKKKWWESIVDSLLK